MGAEFALQDHALGCQLHVDLSGGGAALHGVEQEQRSPSFEQADEQHALGSPVDELDARVVLELMTQALQQGEADSIVGQQRVADPQDQ
jgi:hypothetical protein